MERTIDFNTVRNLYELNANNVIYYANNHSVKLFILQIQGDKIILSVRLVNESDRLIQVNFNTSVQCCNANQNNAIITPSIQGFANDHNYIPINSASYNEKNSQNDQATIDAPYDGNNQCNDNDDDDMISVLSYNENDFLSDASNDVNGAIDDNIDREWLNDSVG